MSKGLNPAPIVLLQIRHTLRPVKQQSILVKHSRRIAAKHLKPTSVAFFFALEYYSLQIQGAQWRLCVRFFIYIAHS